MIRNKTVTLEPSIWECDFYYLRPSWKNTDKLSLHFQKRYGLSKEETDKEFERPTSFVLTVDTGFDSDLKGKTQFACVLLEKPQLDTTETLVHELVHVLWRMEKHVGVEFNFGTQEWQAITLERLFRETKDFKKWNILQ